MAERLTVSIEVVREQLGFVTWYATVQLDEVQHTTVSSVMVIAIKGSDGFESFKYCPFETRTNNF